MVHNIAENNLNSTISAAGIYLGRAIAILALIFRKWRREKTVWGQFGA